MSLVRQMIWKAVGVNQRFEYGQLVYEADMELWDDGPVLDESGERVYVKKALSLEMGRKLWDTIYG